MGLGDRINRIRKQKGISIDQLCEKSGIPKGTLSKITAGITTNPTLDTVKAIACALDCCLDDLDDVPVKKMKVASILSDEAIELAKDYDHLDKWGQRRLRTMADFELSSLKAQRAEGEAVPAEFPYDVIPFRCSVQPASAGTGIYLGPEMFQNLLVKKNNFTVRASFGVPVRGDSMEPLYHDGDILLVNGSEKVNPGEIGVFTLGGEGFVKRLGEDALISINKKYKPIPLAEDIRCNGRVVGVLDPAWIV